MPELPAEEWRSPTAGCIATSCQELRTTGVVAFLARVKISQSASTKF